LDEVHKMIKMPVINGNRYASRHIPRREVLEEIYMRDKLRKEQINQMTIHLVKKEEKKRDCCIMM
jgi:hypothetical protein